MPAWETEPGWEKIVAQPVKKYKMTPANALEILEAAGKLTTVGVSVDRILDGIRGVR